MMMQSGMKVNVIIRIALCKYKPHSRRFFLPKAWLTKVSSAVLTPISME